MEKRTTFTIKNEVAKRFRIFAIQNDYQMNEAVEKALEEFMKKNEGDKNES